MSRIGSSKLRAALVGALIAAVLAAALGGLGGSIGGAAADEPIGWTVNEYVQPINNSAPTDVIVDGDGIVWSTLRSVDALSRLDPATGAIEVHEVPTSGSEPLQLVEGPDGAIWFTELTGAKIGHLDPATGAIEEHDVPGAGAAPTGITVGPDGAIWFTDSALGRIGRLDPTDDTFSFHTLPDIDSKPTDIVTGPDGALWFTLFDIGSLGRMTTDGTYSEVLVEVGSEPFGLTVTTDGLLATNLLVGGAIAFVTTDGAVTQHALPEFGTFPTAVGTADEGGVWVAISTAVNSWVARMAADGSTTLYPLVVNVEPAAIVAAPPNDRGELAWFTQVGPNRVAVLSTDTSAITSFDLPTGAAPLSAAVDAAGHVWFTSGDHNLIGRLDPATSEVSTFPVPTPDSQPNGIVVGADGAIWFTQESADKIGRLDPATGAIEELAVPTSSSQPYEIIVGPDGAIWFTELQVGKLGRVDPDTHAITEIALGPVGTTARGLTIGPDGVIWAITIPPFAFPDVPPGDLTRVGPDGELTHHSLLLDATDPQSITTSGGLLWWDSLNGAFVGSMTTSGTVQQWGADHPTLGIAAGPDGNIWYGGFSSVRLGSLTPEGQMIERVLAGHGTLQDVTVHGGALWITDYGNDQLVRYQVQADPLPVTTTTGAGGQTGQLPATGTSASTTPLLVIGAVLVVGGLALALAARRRFNR